MGLETGTYISDLNPNNPVDATDPVSEGDDHIRLIKSTILNTFPNIDNEVLLTQDEINDAALRSADNVFTGNNRFELDITMPNAKGLIIEDADTTPRNVIGKIASNKILVGNEFNDVVIDALATTTFEINLDPVVSVVPKADGSLEIADGAGAFGDVAAVHKEQTFTALNTFSQQVQTANNIGVGGERVGGGYTNLVRLNTSDRVDIGSTTDAVGINLSAAGSILMFPFGETQSQVQGVANADGALQVRDKRGAFRVAGFRNPGLNTQNSNYTFSQDDESRVIQTSGSNIDFTMAALSPGTHITLFVTTFDGTKLLRGPLSNLRWLNGGAMPNAASYDISRGSVVQIYWSSSATAWIWGNGISET